jgi:AcrR family transcriptional regulator
VEAEERKRDRGRTEAGIVTAARDVLAESGFQGFGVNSVARRAGCDKQLIYRYFGGLEGLVDAIGADIAGWVGEKLEVAGDAPPSDYAELVERMILGFLDALRQDLLVQRIIAWEIAGPSPLVQRLSDARGQALARWVARLRGELVPPPGVDAAALNMILIGAVQQIVLSATAAGSLAGVDLRTEADWQRARQALIAMIRRVYGR